VPPLPQFAGNGFTQVFDSAMAPSGSFVMCGRHNVDVGADDTQGEAFLMKVRSDGTLDWTAVNSTDETEEFRGVTMDDQGNVFATGAYNVIEPDGWFHADALVAAYDSSGNFMWEHRSAGSALLFDGDGHVEINSKGELVASMRHLNDGTLEDMRVFVYDRMVGSILQTALFDASQDDYLFGMAIAPDDRVILAGRTRANGGDADMAVVSVYDPTQTPSCPADTTGDGTVDLADLNAVLANFGRSAADGDTNGDGIVDLADLNAVLGAFGTACE
jgi:hypothetical protein